MQQHRRKRQGTERKRENANKRISASASGYLVSLCEEFRDGDTPGFASSYLVSEYLSKYCSEKEVPASIRKENAVKKWKEVDEKNAQTNARLYGMDRGYNIMPRIPFYTFLKFAQRLTSEILGSLTDELVLGSFSGGASTSRLRSESHAAQKFVGQADVTEGAVPYVDLIHRQSELFRRYGIFYDLREVEAAVLFTVPKKTDIDRCACKEPDINMFLQKAVGRHIRRRLLRAGINLNDQSVNRKLAYQGSCDDSLATLDLSSASDTMTIGCVQALLPTEWFLYLNDIRSHNVELPGGTLVQTSMFSSMGNGFTFELESLIFYVLMRAVSYFEGAKGAISVYGDDIIIPSGMYDSACWVLGEFGFTPNPSKSFAAGPFRESCGGHYHDGEDVTPFYLKREPTRLTDVIRIGNQFRRWALEVDSRQYEYPQVYKMWTSIRDLVPENFWGGRDTSVDTQLVTPDSPRERLVRFPREKKLSELGLYAKWHNSNWNRSSEPEEGFSPVETSSFCLRRRAIPGTPTLAREFREELPGMPDRA